VNSVIPDDIRAAPFMHAALAVRAAMRQNWRRNSRDTVGVNPMSESQRMAHEPSPRPVHTYSIVARDSETGQLGVAVQSHYFATGAIVTWAEAGVGAVATQSFADPSYGKLGLDLMRAGRDAPDALAGLVAADPGREIRQVAMVDARGGAAAHTGASCIAEAGHIVDAGFSVQANMMLRATVWAAMADAYRAATGSLADRLIAALDAAEGEGGDVRGMQSAAMLVVDGKPSGRVRGGVMFDLRVDDHPEPLRELRRLYGVARAYRHQADADRAFAREDFNAGERDYRAAEELIGDNPEMRFWHGVALIKARRVDEAIALLREIFERDPRWFELILRLPAAGGLPADPALFERLSVAVRS
jgi:uncharacterized Ntn-hydrolase superfamily protein